MYIPKCICICVLIFAQFAQVPCRANQQLHQLHKTTGLCRETRLIFSSDCSLFMMMVWLIPFILQIRCNLISFRSLGFHPELHIRSGCVQCTLHICSWCVHGVHVSMMYSHGIKKRPFLTYVEMCFYHIILECPYEGVSFVFADKFTIILTIFVDKYTTINFCTVQ